MPLSLRERFSTLQWRLFSYFSASLLAILIIATAIESVVLQTLLTLPTHTQQQLQALATQADALVAKGDLEALAQWESQQHFSVYVLNEAQQEITQRSMHPHFAFKLNYLRQLQQPMGDRVQQPLIGIPLAHTLVDNTPLTLVVQLNADLHPANSLSSSLWLIRILVGISVLLVFSRLLSRFLIRPLSYLQAGTQALASGQLDSRISQHFSPKEPEFYRLATEFDHMAQQLQHSMQNQQRLLRDISHELRTPLARQELALDILEHKLAGQEASAIDRLRRESSQMASLINTILDFSRLNNAYLSCQPQSIDLHDILTRIVNDCRFEALPSQQIIISELPTQRHFSLDPQYFCRAIENLLRNALKYAGDNANISLNATLLTPETIKNTASRSLLIVIEDDGPGIPESELENVFNPFSRLDDARHSSNGGYGLGLAITKQCIKLLNGEIEATNLKTGGLKLRLNFPQYKSAISDA